jgi:hypothetical protein
MGPTVRFEQVGGTVSEAICRAALNFRVGEVINVPNQFCVQA